MTTEPMVSVKGLGKKYKIYENPLHRLSEWLSFGRRVLHKDFWALSDISFEVNRGECFGIIGENGAGKSTILKILTGALSPTHGEVKIRGRSLSILELGAGFNGELTGRKNVENNAVLLGFPAGYVTQERMRAIENFADIGEFFDRPVKLYSSGMHVRLAFSMFMMMEPDVFIIDEALSVGDIFFSQKCFARIREMMDAGVTFVFVSHDLVAVQNLSQRVMLLSHGKTSFIGEPGQAVFRYWSSMSKTSTMFPRQSNEPHAKGKIAETKTAREIVSITPESVLDNNILNWKNRHGSGGFKILGVRFTDANGFDTRNFQIGDELRIYALAEAERTVLFPDIGFSIHDRMNNQIFGVNTIQIGHLLPQLDVGSRIVVGFKVEMSIMPGQYTLSVYSGEIIEDGSNPNAGHVCDRHDGLGPVQVLFDYTKNRVPFNGLAWLKTNIV